MKQNIQLQEDVQPLILSGSHADREARAKALVTLFVKFLSDHVDLIVEVRQDFLDKQRTETIMGCHTFGEYCRNILHYSESHIRRLIAGRNPATAIYDGSKNRITPLITENVVPHMKTDWEKYALPENWHTAANAFALLPEDSEEFQALVSDIKEHGLNNPVAIYQGKVLDGRNRVRACLAAGVTPTVYEWIPMKEGQTPETWSASQNIYRRHLTADQQKVGVHELRGYPLIKNLRSEYADAGFEKEFADEYKKVKNGYFSLATLVRTMDWLVGGRKVEEMPLTVSGAARAFLRFLSYETALPVYRARQEQLREEARKIFDESWGVIREGIYGHTTDLQEHS